jgi:hypothetical protein
MRHLPQRDTRFLIALQRHAVDDVALGAGIQHHAIVEVHDGTILDRDIVVAVVADAGSEPCAIDGLAVQVDRDAIRADRKPSTGVCRSLLTRVLCVSTWPQ